MTAAIVFPHVGQWYARTPRSFVKEIAFTMSVGTSTVATRGRSSATSAGDLRWSSRIILRPDFKTKELTLTKLHPGTSVEQACEAAGWDLRVADDLGTIDTLTNEELQTFVTCT